LLTYAYTRPDQIIERCQSASIVISNKVALDHDTLVQLPQLKLICVAATGTNNVDLKAAQALGIAVTNVAGYSTHSVVQITFTLLLHLASKMPQLQHAMKTQGWENQKQFVLLPEAFREVSGKTLGIIGFGTIGRAVAQVADAFGMTVKVAQLPHRPSAPDRLPLEHLLPECDVISLHCPLTQETQGLVDDHFLQQMKPSAFLINTARGAIINETALANALRRRQIAGAGLDVLSSEPPPADHPLLATDIPNLVITPHIGWASFEARQRLVNEIAENVIAFRQSQYRNRIV
jgi:glycerate dehydrogenase